MLKSLISDLRSQDWVKQLIKQGNVFIVGGCVRDAIMGQSPKDIDMVVEGPSINDVKELLKHFGKTSLVGQSFSVIKFRPTYHTGEDFDIAVPRIDRKIGTGHKGFETYTEGITIKEDLRRRDFTVNSIAVNLKTKEVLDPFKGRNDIAAKIIRATDTNTFVEDPLRLIRAIQFASRFMFDIEPKTLQLMKRNCTLIREISGERIRGEFDKILYKHGSTRVTFDLIEHSDLDKGLFGEKFHKDGFEYFDNLDLVSFYYVLGNLGHKNPAKFYRDRLKGEASIVKALETLEKYFSKFDDNKPEDEIRWNVFLMIKTSPLLTSSEILPERVQKVLNMMKKHEIPMKDGDIPVNGNDIMQMFDIKDKEVGNFKNYMYREALMKKFNWKDRNSTLKFLTGV